MMKKIALTLIIILSFVLTVPAMAKPKSEGKNGKPIPKGQLKKLYEYEGKVSAVSINGSDKTFKVTAHNKHVAYPVILFRITEDTSFEKGSLQDLKVGSPIKVTYDGTLTKTSPPQAKAMFISVSRLNGAPSPISTPNLNPVPSPTPPPQHITLFYEGSVSGILNNPEGKSISVSTNSDVYNGSAVFKIISTTNFINCSFTDLAIGTKVRVGYYGDFINGYPQANALSIQIISQSGQRYIYQGNVTGVSTAPNGGTITVSSTINNSTYPTLTFNLTNLTSYQGGLLQDIRVGTIVQIEYDLTQVSSTVQAYAYIVKILGQNDQQHLYKGYVSSVSQPTTTSTSVTVYSDTPGSAYPAITFNITTATTFTGGVFTDIRQGTLVQVEYGAFTSTATNPPQAYAITVKILSPVDQRFLYRGYVNQVGSNGTNAVITVLSNNNIDAVPVRQFAITLATTFTGGSQQSIVNGTPVEVQYSAASATDNTGLTNAISIKILAPSELNYIYVGKILEIRTAPEGRTITVVSNNTSFTYPKIVFTITTGTSFVNTAYNSLDINNTIKVDYSALITTTNPPQATALKIEKIN